MMQSTRSEELDRKLRLLGARYWGAVARVWAHEDVAELLPEVLFRMHCEVRASVPLMEAALARAEGLSDDPCAAGLCEYLSELIPEEVGHDEWLLDALEAVGVSRQQAWARTPPHTVAALVGAQYYWVHHFHPVAILGYIKMVEIDPATKEKLERLLARTGLPRAAFKYHFGHAKLELEHNQLLDRVLDTLPLTEEQWSLIGINAVRTAQLLADAVEEILRLHRSQRGSVAAAT